jgi:hypothetical protein
MSKGRHVVPSPSGGWSVRASGAARATKTFPTQADAIHHGKTLAKKDKGELFIHRADGTIRERNSYGNDPHPPKG